MEENKFLEKIRANKINELITDVRGYANEMTIEVEAANIFSALKILKEDFGFTYLADITASDNYIDGLRFQLDYNIINIPGRQRLRVSCRLEEENPEVESATSIWGSANWFEREAYDMIGINFQNHPDLRRMYMPEDFEYHPLRKEFPLLGIPGSIELPPKAEKEYD